MQVKETELYLVGYEDCLNKMESHLNLVLHSQKERFSEQDMALIINDMLKFLQEERDRLDALVDHSDGNSIKVEKLFFD